MNKKPKKASSSPAMSAFRKRVLAVVSNIPKGQVMTYAMVAKKAGNAKASRAVGYYMSQNYDRTVPCHRVIRTDGKIGNYNRGGEKAKRALLKKEGAIL
ncbi:MAG TPA: MGMT family protein [Candidatus Paceibacterota bacterium]|nr:MGMT family protein [Candidatus Paceibacterota bacterium]